MRRQFWVAAALSLSACTPPTYVYDAGSLTRPHPSPASCASQGQQLDNDTQECFTPSTPPPKHAQSQASTAAQSPAPNAGATNVPIETGAVINNDLRRKAKLLNELVNFVTENGYQCDAISAARAYVVSRRFGLVCDHFRNEYEIEAKGRHWIVRAK
jgi:hypothetical protein